MANKFRLTLTIFFCILIFLFLSVLLPSNQLSSHAHEQLNEQDINLAENLEDQNEQVQACENICFSIENYGYGDFVNVFRHPLCPLRYKKTYEDGNYTYCPCNRDGEPECSYSYSNE